MAAMTDYLEEALLNHVLSDGGSFTQPDTYVALYTVAPTDSTAGTEVTGGNYARQQVLPAAWSDPSAGVQGETDNEAAVEFPVATVQWSGGAAVVAVGILDSLAAGNLLLYGDLDDQSKVVGVGDQFTFAIGALNIQFD